MHDVNMKHMHIARTPTHVDCQTQHMLPHAHTHMHEHGAITPNMSLRTQDP